MKVTTDLAISSVTSIEQLIVKFPPVTGYIGDNFILINQSFLLIWNAMGEIHEYLPISLRKILLFFYIYKTVL